MFFAEYLLYEGFKIRIVFRFHTRERHGNDQSCRNGFIDCFVVVAAASHICVDKTFQSEPMLVFDTEVGIAGNGFLKKVDLFPKRFGGCANGGHSVLHIFELIIAEGSNLRTVLGFGTSIEGRRIHDSRVSNIRGKIAEGFLLRKVQNRRNLLDYLKRENEESYKELIKRLGLRR